MRLLQLFLGRDRSTTFGYCRGRRQRRHSSNHPRFESLEQRTVFDAASEALVGLTDYFNNPAFSQFDGTGYAIAVLDTGADMTHDVFDGRIVYDYDFVNNDDDATDDDFATSAGHGTATAGVIAELLPGVDLVILKVINSTARILPSPPGAGWADGWHCRTTV
jgi:subtilisin family serine protease